MSDNADNPMDKLPAHNRVSIRAVLVHPGEDPNAALAEAGFANAVALPVVLGDQPDLPGGILGNGITPNLTAVLETEQEDAQGTQPVGRHPVVRQPATRADPDRARSSGPITTTLPPAYGMQPLAPVRRGGGRRRNLPEM
jgi:hypothetical protein